MKLKFRRGKPPLRIQEKGDRRAELKIAYIAPDGSILKRVCDMTKEEQAAYREKAIVAAVSKLVTLLCPLCLKPLTADNHHTVIFNGKTTAVHKTCPEVKQ